jgi:hypothetical protein
MANGLILNNQNYHKDIDDIFGFLGGCFVVNITDWRH